MSNREPNSGKYVPAKEIRAQKMPMAKAREINRDCVQKLASISAAALARSSTPLRSSGVG
jgi:hypothetical protein